MTTTKQDIDAALARLAEAFPQTFVSMASAADTFPAAILSSKGSKFIRTFDGTPAAAAPASSASLRPEAPAMVGPPPTMKTVISNDPAPIGERCFLCEEPLTPPWLKTGGFRMHTACCDLVCEDFEATHRRRLINPRCANDNTPPMGWE